MNKGNKNKHMAPAFWIGPDGKIIRVNTKHIMIVCENPETFGLTREEIHRIYEKYNEPHVFEGNARQEIMSGLITRGWTRVRFKPKEFFWLIQMGKPEKQLLDNIKCFITRRLFNNDYLVIQSILDGQTLYKGEKSEVLKEINKSNATRPDASIV